MKSLEQLSQFLFQFDRRGGDLRDGSERRSESIDQTEIPRQQRLEQPHPGRLRRFEQGALPGYSLHGRRYRGDPHLPRRARGRELPVRHLVVAYVRHTDRHTDAEQSDDSQWSRAGASDLGSDASTGRPGQSPVERVALWRATLLRLHHRGVRLFTGHVGSQRDRGNAGQTHHAAVNVDLAAGAVLRAEHADRRDLATFVHNALPNAGEARSPSDHLLAVQQRRALGLRHRDHAELAVAGATATILRRARLGRTVQDRAASSDLL